MDAQSGFRSFRFCTNNLVTLTNQIKQAFLRNDFTLAIFLDIKFYDNVVPSILFQDFRALDTPACTCKFIKYLLNEIYLFEREIWTSHHSQRYSPEVESQPLLFNIYLKDIAQHLDEESEFLQYTDNVILYSQNTNLLHTRNSVCSQFNLRLLSLREALIFLRKNRNAWSSQNTEIPHFSPYISSSMTQRSPRSIMLGS